jgi:hypothetical protein
MTGDEVEVQATFINSEGKLMTNYKKMTPNFLYINNYERDLKNPIHYFDKPSEIFNKFYKPIK